MARFLIHHRHTAPECGAVFSSFQGFPSPLRHRTTTASCTAGGHEIWWCVDAEDAEGALALVPPFVARRSDAARVSEVEIP